MHLIALISVTVATMAVTTPQGLTQKKNHILNDAVWLVMTALISGRLAVLFMFRIREQVALQIYCDKTARMLTCSPGRRNEA
jgi:hypothetical protein